MGNYVSPSLQNSPGPGANENSSGTGQQGSAFWDACGGSSVLSTELWGGLLGVMEN